jgi:hypothetical protein
MKEYIAITVSALVFLEGVKPTQGIFFPAATFVYSIDTYSPHERIQFSVFFMCARQAD